MPEMKPFILLLCCFLLTTVPLWPSSETEKLLKELETCILNKDTYLVQKQERIDDLLKGLTQASENRNRIMKISLPNTNPLFMIRHLNM